jgi:hypothetical protein
MLLKIKKTTRKRVKIKGGRTYKTEENIYRFVGSFTASDIVGRLQTHNRRNAETGRTDASD